MNEANMQAGMSQRQVATAAMQLGVRILQAGSMELGHIVRHALEKNPVLELEDPGSYEPINLAPSETGEDEKQDDDWEANIGTPSVDHDATARRDFFFDSIAASQTLAGFLHEQAHMMPLDDKTAHAVSILIDSLDGRGFFDESPEDIASLQGIDGDTLREALQIVREMEPPGVGARDLRDSLLIQLKQAGEDDSVAAMLIRDHWDDLVRHRYDLIAKNTGLSKETLSSAIARIGKLNPDPGDGFSNEYNPEVSPDIIVEEEPGGELGITLTNAHIPKLKLSDYYKDTLSEHYDNAELRSYLKKAFKEGRELIQAIDQRQETVYKVAMAIVTAQQDYFRQGPKHLKPISMSDLADGLGIHVSTVSRAVAGKYLLCKWGLRELRSFFTSGIAASSPGDDAVSSSAIHEVIRELIDSEDKAKPFSDAVLVKKLQERGLDIARRTVAKYREQMKILPASLRKIL